MMKLPVEFRHSILAVFCGIVCALFGCGPDPSAPLTDTGQLTGLVYNFSDAARSQATFAAMFAASKSPTESERKKYASLNFRPLSDVEINGDQATLKVLVRDLNDQDLAEMEWQAVRENGAWKLTLAPLPK